MNIPVLCKLLHVKFPLLESVMRQDGTKNQGIHDP